MTSTGPSPCSPTVAVQRALSLRGNGGQYVFGTGDFHPGASVDVPWTENNGMVGSDCAGFAISWCYKLPRHRPGFNRGPWASVVDDLNCNSLLEDAHHKQEIAEIVHTPELGALLCYPTFHLNGHIFIGHAGIVVGLDRCLKWSEGAYGLLDVAQCCGPNGRSPAVIRTTGQHWQDRDATWPKPEHRTWMVRVRPQIT